MSVSLERHGACMPIKSENCEACLSIFLYQSQSTYTQLQQPDVTDVRGTELAKFCVRTNSSQRRWRSETRCNKETLFWFLSLTKILLYSVLLLCAWFVKFVCSVWVSSGSHWKVLVVLFFFRSSAETPQNFSMKVACSLLCIVYNKRPFYRGPLQPISLLFSDCNENWECNYNSYIL